jgi:hypothetical protein
VKLFGKPLRLFICLYQQQKCYFAASNEFYLEWNFTNCVGSIDGKHIQLKCPSNSGSMYYNYKGYYSIVLQQLLDARYRFIAIDVGAYGKQSDGGIFHHSSLYQLLSSNNFNMPNAKELPLSDVELPSVILGDEAYPFTQLPYEAISQETAYCLGDSLTTV